MAENNCRNRLSDDEERKHETEGAAAEGGAELLPEKVEQDATGCEENSDTSGIGEKSSTSPSSNKSPEGKSPKSVKVFLKSAARTLSFRSAKKQDSKIPPKTPKGKGVFQRAKETLESGFSMFSTSKATPGGALSSSGEDTCLVEHDELLSRPQREEPSTSREESPSKMEGARKKQWGMKKLLSRKSANFLDAKFDETNDPLIDIFKNVTLDSLGTSDESSSQATSEKELIKSRILKDVHMSSQTSSSTDEGVVVGLPSTASSDQCETDSSYLGSSANVFLPEEASGKKPSQSQSDAELSQLPNLDEYEEDNQEIRGLKDEFSEKSSDIQRRKASPIMKDDAGGADKIGDGLAFSSSPNMQSRLNRQRRLSEIRGDSDTEDEVTEARASSSSPKKRSPFHRQKRTEGDVVVRDMQRQSPSSSKQEPLLKRKDVEGPSNTEDEVTQARASSKSPMKRSPFHRQKRTEGDVVRDTQRQSPSTSKQDPLPKRKDVEGPSEKDDTSPSENSKPEL